MKLLYEDYIPESVITNADDITTGSGHDIQNIQDPRLSNNAWISNEGYAASMYNQRMYNENMHLNITLVGGAVIDFDLQAVQSFNTMAIAGNNFTNFDITVTWSDTDINVPTGSYHYTSVGAAWVALFALVPGTTTGRYVRVSIVDANPVGNWLVIGRISLGTASEIPDMAPIYDTDYISNANRAISSTRQLYGGPKVIYRRVNITYPIVEDKADLIAFFRAADLYNPFYVDFSPECDLDEPLMYATLAEETLPFNFNEAHIYTSRLSFTEVF